MLLALVDLVLRGPWSVGFRRQTDPRWRRRLGPEWAALLWGVELGLGFTTVRVTAVYWAAVALVLLLGSPRLGALTMATYGLALGATLLWGQRFLLRRPDGHLVPPRYARTVRRGLALGLATWCAALLLALAAAGGTAL
jgi:hypothetical protein